MNIVLQIFGLGEVVSLLCYVYMYIFGEWDDISNRYREDTTDFLIVTFMMALLLGFISFPIFILVVITDIMNKQEE